MTDPDEAAATVAALRADNARLRRLLDKADTPAALRHAFRDTAAMLRAVVRRSAETAEEVEAYAAHLEGRIDALVRVRERTDAFGEADLHTLVSDELLIHVVREGERALIEGPSVQLQPRAARVVALAVHELATNAIEHGPLRHADGTVTVAWGVEPGSDGPLLTLVWKERGAAGLSAPSRRGFGTEVLEEMLAYELGARTDLACEPDGLRCTVRLPLTDRVGRLSGEP